MGVNERIKSVEQIEGDLFRFIESAIPEADDLDISNLAMFSLLISEFMFLRECSLRRLLDCMLTGDFTLAGGVKSPTRTGMLYELQIPIEAVNESTANLSVEWNDLRHAYIIRRKT